MMYHPIKCCCKNISSSVDTVKSQIWLYEPPLWPWTWRQQTNLLAWHSGSWWCSHTGLVTEGSAVEEILSRQTITGILNLTCDLDHNHNIAIQSYHKTIHLMMMYHQTRFSCKRISSSDNILKSHILIMWSFTVTLTLKTANKSFWRTILLMMMLHHTKFGSKRFSSSKDIIWTYIHCHFEILLWPRSWAQHSNSS